MLGYLWVLIHLILGVFIANRLFMEQRARIRIWAGVAIGFLLMMWAPVPFAFFVKFSPLAHGLGIALGVAFCVVAWYFKKKAPSLRERLDKADIGFLCTVLPLTILIGFLMITHYFMPDPAGSQTLFVGQSTYGDLCLHSGIATGLATQQTFPPDYTIMTGQLLAYPFLADALSGSMLLFGSSLQAAFIVPGILMAFLVFGGLYNLALEVAKKVSVAVVSSTLFFLNGGLGFIYFLDGAIKEPTNFTRIFTEFYETPTNLPDLNLRWVNVIADMMIPQRTTLFGWGILLFALWLLYVGITKHDKKYYLCAGVTAGLMPLIHTHSFLALGLVAATWFVVYFFSQEKQERKIGKWLDVWFNFGAPAVLIAMPQVFYWTFQQAVGDSFMRWAPGWVNEVDPWPWFWIKNVGLVFPLMIAGYFFVEKRVWKFALGGLPIFIIAQLWLFQPNSYDNNKLLYVWFMLGIVLVASFCVEVFSRMRGRIGRYVVAALFIVVSVFSGSLSLAREGISRYEIFGEQEVRAAEFVKENTPKDAVFINADQHNFVMTSLTGRSSYVGTSIYLHFHGLGYQERRDTVSKLYQDLDLLKAESAKYGIDYIYLSDHEKNAYKTGGVSQDAWNKKFREKFTVVFDEGSVAILAVSERAIALAKKTPKTP